MFAILRSSFLFRQNLGIRGRPKSVAGRPLLYPRPRIPKIWRKRKEGTRTRSSSPPSSRSDFGPFSALRPFDDADPRELAGEGWDSDADCGFGGFVPCDSGLEGRDKGKPRRPKDSAAAAAPLRRGKRQRDPGTLGSIPRLPSDSHDRGVKEGANGVGGQRAVSPTDARPLSPIPADRSLGGRKRPLLASHFFSNGGHQPCASSSHPVRLTPRSWESEGSLGMLPSVPGSRCRLPLRNGEAVSAESFCRLGFPISLPSIPESQGSKPAKCW